MQTQLACAVYASAYACEFRCTCAHAQLEVESHTQLAGGLNLTESVCCWHLLNMPTEGCLRFMPAHHCKKVPFACPMKIRACSLHAFRTAHVSFTNVLGIVSRYQVFSIFSFCSALY